jgi:hypothetical protein
MAQLCPSCNKFAGLEMNDPEVNSLDLNDRTIEAEVRIVRVSTCCNDEMKEYTFNTEMELPDEIADKMTAIQKDDPDATFDVEEGSLDQVEEGGGRYAKSYYGYTLTVSVKHGDVELGTVELTDKCAASEMDELT